MLCLMFSVEHVMPVQLNNKSTLLQQVGKILCTVRRTVRYALNPACVFSRQNVILFLPVMLQGGVTYFSLHLSFNA
jgi:hypothetical protein